MTTTRTARTDDDNPDRHPTGRIRPLTWIKTSVPNTTGWQDRHTLALALPSRVEQPIVQMLAGWIAYAQYHQDHFGSLIGHDYVLGPAWAQVGAAVRTLLNGELGRLDAGTLDSLLTYNLTAQGFDPDRL